MNKMGRVKLLVEKTGSKYVPYHIAYSVWDEDKYPEVDQEIYLLETCQIGLPDFDFKLEVGDRVEFEADFYGEYRSYMTDCGTEHDAYFEFRNVKDLLVWRAVYES